MDRTIPTSHALLRGLRLSEAVLFDERSRPDFRDVYGRLAEASSDLFVAVTRVRLSTIDLSKEELDHLTSIRLVVAELNGLTLDAEARLIRSDPTRAGRVERFRTLLEEGRLEVRSAPLGGWAPDFTVFGSPDGAHSVLSGFHWFERPYPHRGPAFAALHLGDAARLAARRHQALWDEAHDVGTAVWSILSRAERLAAAV